MRTSSFLLATLKEAPADAQLISHQLMVRGGFVRKLSAGLYTWMPLGYRVLKRVMAIVEQEMDAIGAQQLLMPSIQPAELWQESGRWDLYGPLMLRMQDRNGRDFCYGPTHEEVITDLMRRELSSYKQLPMTFYQIQTKFRDELRPRFGVMRAREFTMKDAYSFDTDEAALQKTYDTVRGAYCRIFSRLGLDFRVVLADSGEIGGEASEEFHVLAGSGEDVLAYAEQGDYAANIETAQAKVTKQRPAPSQEMARCETKGITTVPEQAKAMGLSETQIVKTLFVEGEKAPVVALLLRGDHTLNPLKAEKHPLIKTPLTPVSEELYTETTGCTPGFGGPIGLSIPLIADHEVLNLADFSCGANETDFHFKGVNWERDLPVPEAFDLRNVEAGDLSPTDEGPLALCRGIEVGHIFQLGDKYSKRMSAQILGDNGKAKPMQMGCYGIGVSRIVAAAIEQHHDADGIVWPDSMAPFQVGLVMINPKGNEAIQSVAEELYTKLQAAGISVLLDDRKERPGVMFSDMELIGLPHRMVISARGVGDGVLEHTDRRTKETTMVPIAEAIEFLQARCLADLKIS